MSVSNIISKVRPNEIYNLAAQSHVKVSFEIPMYTADLDALGTLRILETVKNLKLKTKIYNASTSELYGDSKAKIMNEKTKFSPVSPYGIAKLYAFEIVRSYRKAYNIFASNGILFNHESPRRGETFVTKKITLGLSNYIKHGKYFELGNLSAKRDWGHARDYVEGMWKILQLKKPIDLVLSTGKTYSVEYFLTSCLKYLNIKFKKKIINKQIYFIDIKNRDDALNFSVNRIKLIPEDKNSKKINGRKPSKKSKVSKVKKLIKLAKSPKSKKKSVKKKSKR
jgi:GDPmannose 4,6-dehydratase